jgi:hypothetical protein
VKTCHLNLAHALISADPTLAQAAMPGAIAVAIPEILAAARVIARFRVQTPLPRPMVVAPDLTEVEAVGFPDVNSATQ